MDMEVLVPTPANPNLVRGEKSPDLFRDANGTGQTGMQTLTRDLRKRTFKNDYLDMAFRVHRIPRLQDMINREFQHLAADPRHR